jgi:hypothetical protein
MRDSTTQWSYDPVGESTIVGVSHPTIGAFTLKLHAGKYGQSVEKVVRDIGRAQSYISELLEKGAVVDESENQQRAVSIVS